MYVYASSSSILVSDANSSCGCRASNAAHWGSLTRTHTRGCARKGGREGGLLAQICACACARVHTHEHVSTRASRQSAVPVPRSLCAGAHPPGTRVAQARTQTRTGLLVPRPASFNTRTCLHVLRQSTPTGRAERCRDLDARPPLWLHRVIEGPIDPAPEKGTSSSRVRGRCGPIAGACSQPLPDLRVIWVGRRRIVEWNR